MKKYIPYLLLVTFLVITFIFFPPFKVDLAEEITIKEIIPSRLSSRFNALYERIHILDREEIEDKHVYYLISLSSEKGREIFVVTLFNSSKGTEEEINIACKCFLKNLGLNQDMCMQNFDFLYDESFLALMITRSLIDGKSIMHYINLLQNSDLNSRCF